MEDFQDQVEDQFRTSIKGDGIKLFVYKVRKVNNKELPTSTVLNKLNVAAVTQVPISVIGLNKLSWVCLKQSI